MKNVHQTTYKNHPWFNTIYLSDKEKDVLANPLSNAVHSEQSGYPGITQYTYAKQIYTALGQMISQCPMDVELIAYNHPLFYQATFNLTTSMGEITSKDVIICVIKYKKADGKDYIAHFGTGVNEFLANQ